MFLEGYSAGLAEEVAGLLEQIGEEAGNLRRLFITEEERKARDEASQFFDKRVRETVLYTLRNLEAYRQYGWKELVYGEEDGDG